MIVRGLANAVDERFLTHRLRSTSVAGVVGALTAGGLFLHRYYVQHRLDWGLFAVIAAMAAAKVGVFLWYRRTD
jgi:hypothetical protein